MGLNGNTVHQFDLTPPVERTWSIHPPESAKFDEVAFAHWVQEVGRKLLRARLTHVHLVPVVVETGELYLTVFCDEDTGRKIKAALYN